VDPATHVAIPYKDGRVWVQRTGVQSCSESPLSATEEVILHLVTVNARLRAAAEQALTAGLSYHGGHWDDTQRGGDGCPLCIKQKAAADSLRAALAGGQT
jgi:hypothetical protein